MSRRRSKLEIYLEILLQIKMGVKKPTRIMYGVNVSWKSLQEAFGNLIGQELIREVDTLNGADNRTTKIYELTSKGESVLSYFKKAETLLGIKQLVSIRDN
jgi:predicted transcriptional regulator